MCQHFLGSFYRHTHVFGEFVTNMANPGQAAAIKKILKCMNSNQGECFENLIKESVEPQLINVIPIDY